MGEETKLTAQRRGVVTQSNERRWSLLNRSSPAQKQGVRRGWDLHGWGGKSTRVFFQRRQGKYQKLRKSRKKFAPGGT